MKKIDETRVTIYVLLGLSIIGWAAWIVYLKPWREDPDSLEAYARGYGIVNYGIQGSKFYDLVEDTPAYKACVKEVDALVQEEMDRKKKRRGTDFAMGDCHFVERLKKQILKDKYGIDWRGFTEMNPGTCYD